MASPRSHGSSGWPTLDAIEAFSSAMSIGCSVWSAAGSKLLNSAHARKKAREYQLARHDEPPVLLEERREVVPTPVRERRRGRRHEQQQPYQRDANAGDQAQRGEYPRHVSDQENPERLAEAVTPVRKLGKQKPGKRKSRQSYYLDCYQPEQNVYHSRRIILKIPPPRPSLHLRLYTLPACVTLIPSKSPPKYQDSPPCSDSSEEENAKTSKRPRPPSAEPGGSGSIS